MRSQDTFSWRKSSAENEPGRSIVMRARICVRSVAI